MWSELSLPWQAALEEAWAAGCAGCVPIGSVVVDAAGRTISRGRNHIYDCDIKPGQLCQHSLAHAELNALLAFRPVEIDGERDPDPHECSLYTTTEPCPMCLGAIYMSGVRSFHYAMRDAYAGSANLLGATAYLSRKPVRVYGPQNPALETLLTALQTDFHLRKYDDPARCELVLQTWNVDLPEGVELGRRWCVDGVVERMQDTRTPARAAFELLSAWLGNGG